MRLREKKNKDDKMRGGSDRAETGVVPQSNARIPRSVRGTWQVRDPRLVTLNFYLDFLGQKKSILKIPS